MVITTDAGVGKTITMQWLSADLNRPDSDIAAFFLTFSRMPNQPADLIREAMLPEFRRSLDGDAATLSENDAALW